MVFSIYLNIEISSKSDLCSLFQYLITKNNLRFILDDLRERMTEESNIIINYLALYGYLHWLKCKISPSINYKFNDEAWTEIREEFEWLRELARSCDKNKFYIGKSPIMVELVELLFNTKLEGNKNHPEMQLQILENKGRIIEKWSRPLLDCLGEALPYHWTPFYLNKYLKIGYKLSYAIKESCPVGDTAQEWQIVHSLSKFDIFLIC